MASDQAIIACHCRDQRFDHIIAGFVAEVARGDPTGVPAPPVAIRLVQSEGVKDEGQLHRLLAQFVGELAPSHLAHIAVGIAQFVEHEGHIHFVAQPIEAEGARQLGEEARPGAAASHLLFDDDLLFGFAEVVGAVAPLRLQVIVIISQDRISQDPLGRVIVQRVPLQVEEDEFLAQARFQLFNPRDRRLISRVAGIGGKVEKGETSQAPAHIVDRLQRLIGIAEVGRAHLRDLSAPAPLKIVDQRPEFLDISIHLRVVQPAVENRQVPEHGFGAGAAFLQSFGHRIRFRVEG